MRALLFLALAAAALLAPDHSAEATLERLLRRQVSPADHNATANQDAARGSPAQPVHSQRAGAPNMFMPNQGPTPFLPFGLQLPAGLRDGRMFSGAAAMAGPGGAPGPMPAFNPAPLFNSDLSKKLLAFIGVGAPTSGSGQNDTSSVRSAGSSQPPDPRQVAENLMSTFRNASAMQELSKGLTGVLGGLSKMYNSTVQQQLGILQTRIRRETENSTDPWHQRMLAGMPDFFKMMSLRVMGAQRRLDDIYRQFTQARNGSERSADLDPEDPLAAAHSRAAMFPANLMQFWQNQVQPQIGMMRSQLSNAWRDLTSSGLMMRSNDPMLRSASGSSSSSADLVDSLLKEVDTNNTEYVLFDAKAISENNQQPQLQNSAARLTTQMQTGLMSMQREINGLWNSLSRSLQGAIANVRGTRSATSGDDGAGNNRMIMEADPSENEISAKIADLSKVQRDADVMLNVVQQQQRQQNPSFMNRFMSMFYNADLRRMELFSPRFTDPFMRIGDAIGDFWHDIPNQWDRFMTHVRPQASFTSNIRSLPAAGSTTSTTTTKKPEMLEIATN